MRENSREEYFENFKIKFDGKIVSMKHGGHDMGLFQVKLSHSSTEYYKPNGQFERYFCEIEKGIAKLPLSGYSRLELGDSVAIDGERLKLLIMRGNDTIQSGSLVSSIWGKEFFKGEWEEGSAH